MHLYFSFHLRNKKKVGLNINCRIAENVVMIIKEVFFFLSGFSFTDTDDSQDSSGREGAIFYSTLPLPPAHEH